jgi:DNA polymerase I
MEGIFSQLLRAGSKVEPLKRGQTSHSLKSVVERELGVELDKTQQGSDWGGTLTPEMIEYAARDVEVLLPLYEVLKAKIEEADLTYVAEIEHRALPAVVWMSGAGVPIDADGWREHARRSESDAARLKDELHVLAPEHPEGEVWNFGSHQQVKKAAKLLGVDLPDTRDETLALYAKEHEFIAALRNYRKVSKLASTYGAAWLENGYQKDGRIYASWRQVRAATGRMACDHPNLQNIPRSRPLRSYIRPPEGRVFVIADYSQIELRIVAKISGDQEMLSAYAESQRPPHAHSPVPYRSHRRQQGRPEAGQGGQFRVALWDGSKRTSILRPKKLRSRDEPGGSQPLPQALLRDLPWTEELAR